MKEYVYLLFRELYNDYTLTSNDNVSFTYYVDNMSELCSKRTFNKQIKNHPLLEDTFEYFIKHIAKETPYGYISKMFFFTTEYYLIEERVSNYFYIGLRKEKINAITGNK